MSRTREMQRTFGEAFGLRHYLCRFGLGHLYTNREGRAILAALPLAVELLELLHQAQKPSTRVFPRLRISGNSMKKLFALVLFTLIATVLPALAEPVSIFDGKTFSGWEGDTNKTWRIEGGALIGGSLEAAVPHNEFICTRRSFTNFV